MQTLFHSLICAFHALALSFLVTFLSFLSSLLFLSFLPLLFSLLFLRLTNLFLCFPSFFLSFSLFLFFPLLLFLFSFLFLSCFLLFLLLLFSSCSLIMAKHSALVKTRAPVIALVLLVDVAVLDAFGICLGIAKYFDRGLTLVVGADESVDLGVLGKEVGGAVPGEKVEVAVASPRRRESSG